mgnify:CR=1 FL=1
MGCCTCTGVCARKKWETNRTPITTGSYYELLLPQQSSPALARCGEDVLGLSVSLSPFPKIVSDRGSGVGYWIRTAYTHLPSVNRIRLRPKKKKKPLPRRRTRSERRRIFRPKHFQQSADFQEGPSYPPMGFYRSKRSC